MFSMTSLRQVDQNAFYRAKTKPITLVLNARAAPTRRYPHDGFWARHFVKTSTTS
jgi:hypothetical protein